MRYEPIKKTVGRFFGGSLFMRRILYSLLDLLLLRSWHVRRALRKISGELDNSALILDAGSGFGQYTWRLSQINHTWKIDAVDINSEHTDDCTRFFSKAGLADRVNFRTMDLTTLESAGNYDLVLSVDVMEHIEEDEKVFRNFFRALKPDGILLISTPSDKGGSDVHTDEDESFIDEHVRDGYSIQEITGKLTAAGFRTVEAKYTYGKPGSISWHLSMKYPVRLLNVSHLFFLLLPFYFLVFFPVSVILNFFDLYTTHGSGTGLLVIARK